MRITPINDFVFVWVRNLVSFREEHRLEVLEHRMLRRTFGETRMFKQEIMGRKHGDNKINFPATAIKSYYMNNGFRTSSYASCSTLFWDLFAFLLRI
jgi:hypothetical protein